MVHHGVTQLHLELAVVCACAAEPASAGFWCAPAALYRQGLPTLMRKVAAHARSAGREGGRDMGEGRGAGCSGQSMRTLRIPES
jgi:hypothetical protein